MLLEYIKPLRGNPAELLYHKDIGFPDDINLPRGFSPVMNLRYSSHATEESFKDVYGEIELPRRIDVSTGQTIEIGVVDKTVTKMVIRFPYDDEKDIVLVIVPENGFVKTAWFNLKDDQHHNLNRSKYTDPKRPGQPAATSHSNSAATTQQQWRDRQQQKQQRRH